MVAVSMSTPSSSYGRTCTRATKRLPALKLLLRHKQLPGTPREPACMQAHTRKRTRTHAVTQAHTGTQACRHAHKHTSAQAGRYISTHARAHVNKHAGGSQASVRLARCGMQHGEFKQHAVCCIHAAFSMLIPRHMHAACAVHQCRIHTVAKQLGHLVVGIKI